MNSDVPNSIRKAKPEILSMVVSIAVILACSMVLIQGSLFLYDRSRRPQPKVLSPGQKLSAENIKWSSRSKTVLLGLSTTCHFCSESYPFYRRLSAAANLKADEVIAIFPQDVNSVKNYLESEKLKTDQILQGPLKGIDISATPTLLIVTPSGVVQRVWVGKLSSDQEQEVLDQL